MGPRVLGSTVYSYPLVRACLRMHHHRCPPHERKQKGNESVDAYTQDLRRAQQGSQEAEDMGRSVLASQFVAGLLPDVKLKLV